MEGPMTSKAGGLPAVNDRVPSLETRGLLEAPLAGKTSFSGLTP